MKRFTLMALIAGVFALAGLGLTSTAKADHYGIYRSYGGYGITARRPPVQVYRKAHPRSTRYYSQVPLQPAYPYYGGGYGGYGGGYGPSIRVSIGF